MEYACRMVTPFGLSIAKHIKRDSVADIFPGAHAVDGFLHLAVTTVATFHGVGSRREQLMSRKVSAFSRLGLKSFWRDLPSFWKRHTRRRSLASFCRAVSLRQRRVKRR